jgi:hypothetical protein
VEDRGGRHLGRNAKTGRQPKRVSNTHAGIPSRVPCPPPSAQLPSASRKWVLYERSTSFSPYSCLPLPSPCPAPKIPPFWILRRKRSPMANLYVITCSSFLCTVSWLEAKSTGSSFRQGSGRDNKKSLAQRIIPFVRELSSVVRTETCAVRVSFSAFLVKRVYGGGVG